MAYKDLGAELNFSSQCTYVLAEARGWVSNRWRWVGAKRKTSEGRKA
jgi:hypothetical protein